LKIANFTLSGSNSVALIESGRAYEIPVACSMNGVEPLAKVKSVEEILKQNLLKFLQENAKRIVSSSEGIELGKVKLLSPILRPQKILLAAVNYISHSREQDLTPPPEPYFFSKFQNAIIGPEDPIIIPRISAKVDWEVELAVVIGKRGKYIPKNEARKYIGGYTISNDISFRDLQFPPGWPDKPNPLGQNWIKGKALDNSLPMGPWLVTPDEINDPYNLEISLSVNGNVMQKSNTSEMIFNAEEMIEYLSSGITLEPGDVISTGTPLGVAAFTRAPYLKDGDVVEASISGIGTLRNPVRSEI
jgi:2-keto-4-pentenoate hydratase/2-oxohepta-3-ene-1,7-dioic acid hydratase in catechol pathway